MEPSGDSKPIVLKRKVGKVAGSPHSSTPLKKRLISIVKNLKSQSGSVYSSASKKARVELLKSIQKTLCLDRETIDVSSDSNSVSNSEMELKGSADSSASEDNRFLIE